MQEFDQKMAQVVYYLCRNGKVESPHMIDVEFHSPGLRLRDVKLRLTTLRGCRMPAMYSWSFKRIYKNTSIWQDVSDDDFVLPVLSGEYVLKGSEIVDNTQSQVLKAQSLKQPSELQLQRKFWGAESWLTSANDAPAPKASSMQAQRRSWEQAQQFCIRSSTASKRLLSVGESSSSDEKESSQLKLAQGPHDSNSEAVRHSTGSISHHEAVSKVYSIKPPLIDHGCDATTQTEELRRQNPPAAPQASSSEERKACIIEETKKELPPVAHPAESSPVPGFSKKQNRGKKQDHTKGSKNSGSWMFLHVLSYCGASGLDTKAQQGGNTPLVTRESQIVSSDCSHEEHESSRVTDGENFSFSDASRETHQSRASTTGDSFNSSDASDEGRAQGFVDVKELLVSSSSSRAGAPSSGKSSLLGRNYGRLSKSGSHWPRNIKYDMNRRHLENGFELNCYNAE